MNCVKYDITACDCDNGCIVAYVMNKQIAILIVGGGRDL